MLIVSTCLSAGLHMARAALLMGQPATEHQIFPTAVGRQANDNLVGNGTTPYYL